MEIIQTKPFSWTYSELVKIYKASKRNLNSKEIRTWIAVIIAIILLIISPLLMAALFMPTEREYVFNNLLGFFKWGFIICFGYFTFLFILLRLRLWIEFQANSKLLQMDRTVTFAEQGINVVSSVTKTHLNWAYIQSIKESKEFFFLYYGKNLYLAIPQKALDNFQIENLRVLLKNKIEKYKMIS